MAPFLARRVVGGSGKVREKEEELESYLWVVLAGRSWAVHGEGRPAVALLGNSGSPVALEG